MKLQIDELGKVGIDVEDWNQDLSYDARVITTDYSTWITYISRKKVPAGTPITDIRYWKPITRVERSVIADYALFKARMEIKMDELEQLVNSFIATAQGGTALSNNFGDSSIIGVTQKALTNAINALHQRITDVTGEDFNGVNISIVPEIAISKGEIPVNIYGTSDYGNFESVKVFVNNNEVVSLTDVDEFSESTTITATSKIRVIVMSLGKEYVEEETIKVNYPFFIGCGNLYSDVVNDKCAREYNGTPKGSYPVHCYQGERIFIVIDTESASLIEQIEMNDINIPMTTSVEGEYTIYTSRNVYNEGDYIIDINY